MPGASSGGRQLQHAAVVMRRAVPDAGGNVLRKELSAICRMAAEALGLRASLRLVLSELVANWGEQPWQRLLVWPSNEHLMQRTGLSERTLRDAFRKLAALGLMLPKDSPNGKRYAIRNRAGTVVDAYGFDLTPLYANRDGWAHIVAERKHERLRIKRRYDELTIVRRATEEAIRALCELAPGRGGEALSSRYAALLRRTPRRSTKMPPDGLLETWMELRLDAEEMFLAAGRDGQICRHNESHEDSSGEACNSDALTRLPQPQAGEEGAAISDPAHRESTEQDELEIAEISSAGGRPMTASCRNVARSTAGHRHGHERAGETSEIITAVIRDACPSAFGYGRPVETVPDVIDLGRFMRSLLGASEAAWIEAELALGSLQAAVAVIYVVQLYEDDMHRRGGESRIRNPGGYLRAFVRMVAAGKIDLTADLFAMRRRRLAS